MTTLEITLKLLLAIALGGIIGLERETSQKPAGLRTNTLICVGSAMMMILSQLMLGGTPGGSGDMLRIAAGVITGIGFIGAGTIIQARGIVVGLTTASTLWAVAGLGLVVGAGFYLESIIFTSLVLLTLILFRRIEESHIQKTSRHYHLRVKDSPELLVNLRKLTFHLGLKLDEFKMKREKDISVVSFNLAASEEKEQQLSQSLLDLGDIQEITID